MWQDVQVSPLRGALLSREVARKPAADLILQEQLMGSDFVSSLGRRPGANSHAMVPARPRPGGANLASDMR